LVNEFGRDYHPEQAIRWYIREGFTYQMLNRAIRLLKADIIVNMGFFIHDLHQQLKQLQQEQVGNYGGQPFLVYRGQGLAILDFEKLQRSEGGLLSFNCFLSTSSHKDVPIMLAESSAMGTDKVGILFVMTIDPNVSFIPFADIQNVSFFKTEAEILFSMHTVFRIGTIQAKDHGRPYFEVALSLTKDDDMELSNLIEQLDSDMQASDGWERMGQILIGVGQPNKAEELYNTLLEQTSNANNEGRYYPQLGFIKDAQGHYNEALFFYERAMEIFQKSPPANHPDLATSYNNIGLVYHNMGEYSKALASHEQALEIRQKSLPANHPDLATSYNNIGSVYDDMGEYSKALSSFERALEIFQNSLPANQPDLKTLNENMEFLKSVSHKKLITAKSLGCTQFYDAYTKSVFLFKM
jgi:Tfp pilus assembly protein PilF